MATVWNPCCRANCTPRCPSPPMPCTATRSPPRKPPLRRGVVGRDTGRRGEGRLSAELSLVRNGSDSAVLQRSSLPVSTIHSHSAVPRVLTIHRCPPRRHGSHTPSSRRSSRTPIPVDRISIGHSVAQGLMRPTTSCPERGAVSNPDRSGDRGRIG